MANVNLRLLFIIVYIVLSAAGCKTQDVQETLQLRRDLRKLIEAELNNLDSDLNASLGDYYVKTLQELNVSNFQKNDYSLNTTVQVFVPPQCDVGIN